MSALPKTNQAESLQDKVVLLVGGSGSSHLSLAVTLAELGADIAILYSDQQQRRQMAVVRQRVEAADRKCLYILADADNRHLPRAVVRQIAAELGRLDIFIDIDCSKVADQPTEGEIADDESVGHRVVRGSHRPNRFTNLGKMAAAVRQMLESQQTAFSPTD